MVNDVVNAKQTDRLRIAVVITGREGGGIRRFLFTQRAHAAEHALDFEYVCLQPGPMYDALRDAGATVTVVGGGVPSVHPHGPLPAFARWLLPGGGFGATRRGVFEYLRLHRPDCVYSHLLHTQIACGLPARRLGLPHIGQVHGTLNVRRLFGLTRIAYSTALARSLDAIVMVSDTARGSLWGSARRKAQRIYNGIDVRAIERTLPGAAKIPGRAIICGRLTAGKKVELAIRALPRVLGAGINCILEVVGGPADDSNSYYRLLADLVRDLGMHDHVTFTGPIDPPYARLAAAEVCVNCSTVEGFGYVVAEAMACRTPVIVADCGAPKELVAHDRTGLHFRADDEASLADTIVRLLRDAKLRSRLADAAYSHASQTFDISVHLKAMRALFERCRSGSTAW
jgi:glycosyltransferase involved in cell wall biosynthesis